MAKKKKTDIIPYELMLLTQEEATKLLLEEAKKETPDLQVVEDILAYSPIDVNIKDEWNDTPLMIVAGSKNVKCLKLLLKHPKIDVNVQDDGTTALVSAIGSLDYVSVKLLLEAGANPDIKDRWGGSVAFDCLSGMMQEYEYADEFEDDTDYDHHDYATMEKIKKLLNRYSKEKHFLF